MENRQAIKNRFGIIGNSPALNYAIDVAADVANTDLSVLINGSSGVGKEVFSHIIHALSPRKHEKFIAVNCGAIPEGTMDSELFGHEKGSFTGAVESRKGYFETVNGGTIFLDEIGEMPLGTQARLLRVLESGEYIRVGSSKVQKTNVRVIAATNKKLPEQIQAGKFREDLYYRLNTVPIHVPSLKERKDDIPLLFRKFASDFSDKYRSEPLKLSDDAWEVLKNYSWPGNVRQLKNVAEQISVLARGREVTKDVLEKMLPNAHFNQLPVLASTASGGKEFANEREILYKLFFDVKKDVTELKKMFFEVIQNPGLFNNRDVNTHRPASGIPEYPAIGEQSVILKNSQEENNKDYFKVSPITEHQIVEESLNIMDAERDLIVKALKKHKGKRKYAASDLGISERTLYRKLKEYNINDL